MSSDSRADRSCWLKIGACADAFCGGDASLADAASLVAMGYTTEAGTTERNWFAPASSCDGGVPDGLFLLWPERDRETLLEIRRHNWRASSKRLPTKSNRLSSSRSP